MENAILITKEDILIKFDSMQMERVEAGYLIKGEKTIIGLMAEGTQLFQSSSCMINIPYNNIKLVVFLLAI
jgi:hypothetical protein